VGNLRAGITWKEIGAALLPAGSISGAPKASAMAIIDSHEAKRGPYCGILGWVNGDQALLSVGIRIFWSERDGKIHFGTGAGITWGSIPSDEWAETELKAARLMKIARGES
jgi:para-aminobenzoate synthetase component 1